MALILIVDDEQIIRRSFSLILKLKGFEVDSAKNSPEALTKIDSIKPDLVLLDIMMPGDGAKKVVEKIKTNSDLKETKVVYFTAYPDPEKFIKTGKYKPDGIIMKPVSNETLIKTINKILKK